MMWTSSKKNKHVSQTLSCVMCEEIRISWEIPASEKNLENLTLADILYHFCS